jgi:hypothetical protein
MKEQQVLPRHLALPLAPIRSPMGPVRVARMTMDGANMAKKYTRSHLVLNQGVEHHMVMVQVGMCIVQVVMSPTRL